jgi:hypothetical protein
MASLYILRNPGHYTGHKFVPFYWRGYVKEVLSAWDEDYAIVDLEGVEDKVVINKNQGQFVGLSKVSDYVFRPSMYERVSLYDWICLYHKSVKRHTRQKKVGDAVKKSLMDHCQSFNDGAARETEDVCGWYGRYRKITSYQRCFFLVRGKKTIDFWGWPLLVLQQLY